MFAKKHTSMFGAFAIDSKASRGRHARVKGLAQSARCAFEGSAGQMCIRDREENARYARFFSLAISSDLVFPSSPPSAGPDNRA